VTIAITNQDHSLESGSLTGSGLLLDWGDLHDFFLELSFEKLINNLGLLDWDGESVDFLNLLDNSALDESAELGDWLPWLINWSSSALWALWSILALAEAFLSPPLPSPLSPPLPASLGGLLPASFGLSVIGIN